MIKPPIMGWSSWNHFRQNINQEEIYEIANAMIETGLYEAGYQYINLDDCWQSSSRDNHNNLQFDRSNFPDGSILIEKLHDLGFKVGLYSSCGCMTCEDLPASYGHEKKDALRFVSWGIDYLKYDYCHVVDLAVDERWLRKTPKIIDIEFQSLVHPDRRYILEMSNVQLEGKARIRHHKNGYTYLEGLSQDGGCARFSGMKIPPGEYIVTIKYLKEYTTERLMVVLEIDGFRFPFRFPTSSGWSDTGREQQELILEETCEEIILYNPVSDQKSDAVFRYRFMYDALNQAAKRLDGIMPIYEICEHGRNAPWEWAQELCNQYRIGPDIENNWGSVLDCYERAIRLSPTAKEGVYANPDMLEVGNNVLNQIQNEAHFVLWVFLAAPLILGNDIRQMKKTQAKPILDILTNRDLISIHQDAPFLPAKRIIEGDVDVLVKEGSKDIHACFFNKSDRRKNIQVDLNQILEGDFVTHKQLTDVLHKQKHNVDHNLIKIGPMEPNEVVVLTFSNE